LRFAWGAARVVALAVAAWILLACLDATLRTSEPVWRWLALAVWIGCVAFAFQRWALPTLRRPLTLEGTALEVERRFPSLRDRLTDAIEFLEDRRFADALGSAKLRRQMINETWSRVEPLDLRSTLSVRPTAIAAAFALAALALLIVGLAIPASPLRLASARMIAPWTAVEWPRRDRLVVEPDVRSLVRGGRFAIEVRDAEGQPPEKVTLELQSEGASGAQTFDLTNRKDRFRFERSNVETPFSYRVFGGDDDTMAWRRVEIVDPAKVVALEALVTPPAYLQSSSGEIVTRAPGFVRTLAGSTIDVELRLDPEPQIARLVFVPAGAREADAEEFRFDLIRDHQRGIWTLPRGTVWKPAASGEYLFEEGDGAVLSWDAEHGGEPARYRIELVEDAAPRVVVAGLRSGEPVAPGATLPYVAAVTDDVGLSEVIWQIALEGQPDVRLDLPPEWSLGGDPATEEAPADSSRSLTLERALTLNDSRIVAGTSWEAKLVATDLAGNVGESATFRLPIFAPERMATRIAERESRLLSLLREALRLLRDSAQELREVDLSVESIGAIEPGAADRLQRAESNQRNAAGRLFRDDESALAAIDATLASIRDNGLDLPDSAESLEKTRVTLEALRAGAFAGAEAGLRDSLAAVRREELPAPPEFRDMLAGTSTAQDAAIAELERLIGELSEWDSYRRFRDEIAGLVREQEGIAKAVEPIVEKRRQGDDLTAQDRALAVQLAARQREVARRLGKAVEEMEAAAEAIQATDGMAADTLQNAADIAHERGAAGWMQEAARRLETSDWAGAEERQAPIQEALDEIAGELNRRREQRLDRQAKELREAAEEARRLASNETDEGRSEADRRDDREATRDLERKLERLGSREAAQEALDAQTAQANAFAAGQQGDQERVDQERQAAAEKLEDAAAAAETAAEQAEQRLADELMARMRDFFEGLRERQERLRDEAVRLAELGSAAAGWTAGQLASVRAMADEQEGLAEETSAFAAEVESFKAFRLGLSGAQEQMQRAAALARRRRVKPDAIDAQNRALERLVQLLAALDAREQAAQQPQEPQPPQEGGEEGAPQPPPGNREEELNRLAEIRLLALMQQEILRRTRELEQSRAGGETVPPETAEEYRSLAEEQGSLARLVEEYSQAAAAEEPPPIDPLDVDEALENLPELPAPQP
jgi:hypothetical protein